MGAIPIHFAVYAIIGVVSHLSALFFWRTTSIASFNTFELVCLNALRA